MGFEEIMGIRNVAILGHGGCGKTTLTEAIAYISGAVNRQGRVEDGSTISDYDKEEIKHHFSISSVVVPVKWKDTKINILDTPGYFDFIGKVEEALLAADACVIVISAKSGVEVGARKAWEFCEMRKLPCMFFVTGMDEPQTDFYKVIDKLSDVYGKKMIPFQLPVKEGDVLTGYVDVVERKGKSLSNENEECEIPSETTKELLKYRDILLEAVAESNEELLDKYFAGEEFLEEEIVGALCEGVLERSIVPILIGTGVMPDSTKYLLDAVRTYFPSPQQCTVTGFHQKRKEEFVSHYDIRQPMTAQVFQTIADPFIGKFSFVKIYSGILKADDTIYNVTRGSEEKLSRLYVLRGKEQFEVKQLRAGDIGAIAKLGNTVTGDSLATKENPVLYKTPEFSKPYTYVRYQAKKKGEDDKISQAMQKILEEDCTLYIENDTANHQSLLHGIGELHLEVVASKLQNRFKAEVEMLKPKVPYREAIRKKVSVRGKYKKQSGGHGQYGDVLMEFEPLGDYEIPYQFQEKIFGGAVPKNYFPAVEKGVAESTLKGPLAGYPVVGIKAILTDGSYHPVDSSEFAFKMAAIQAFKQGFADASPVLLEPIVSLKVVIPDRFTGDVMGDLNKRRGRVTGMNPIGGGKQEIMADIPLSETFGYSTVLRSMTGGFGEYSYVLARYEQAPTEVQEQIVKEAKE